MKEVNEVQLQAVCICNTGKVRTNNEDNFYFDGVYLEEENEGLPNVIVAVKEFPYAACYAVFDGMGGEACGEKAAYIAAKAFSEAFTMQRRMNSEWLTNVCLKMNEEVCKESSKRDFIRMGSTVAIMCFNENKGYVCNLGDSKIFLFRDNVLCQLSKDHTDELILKEYGIRTRKPCLTQHLGIHPSEMVIEPYSKEVVVEKGDRYLICSDGLTDMVENSRIQVVLQEEKTLKAAVLRLHKIALEQGGRDNITIILLEVN